MLSKCRLHWLCDIRRMDKGRFGTRPIGRPCLRSKDSCKRDLQSVYINVATWEVAALDHPGLRRAVRSGVTRVEEFIVSTGH